MDIMAAAVKAPIFRSKGQSRFLSHRQSVNIRPKEKAFPLPFSNHRRKSPFAAVSRLYAHFPQLSGNEGESFLRIKARFRKAMDFPAAKAHVFPHSLCLKENFFTFHHYFFTFPLTFHLVEGV